jgi:general secretion pathway protein G
MAQGAVNPGWRGFTMIELMVVMTLVALLLTIVAPRFLSQIDRAREDVLRNNLKEARAAIDHYYTDTGKYPDSLRRLVEQRYLRALPVDPLTGRTDNWVLVAPTNASAGGAAPAAIYDLHSSATGRARDGSVYATW